MQYKCATCKDTGRIRLLSGWAKCPDCKTDKRYEEWTERDFYNELMNKVFGSKK